jgi:hypothetical protein
MLDLQAVRTDTTHLKHRIERKFFIEPHKIDFARMLLSQFCYPDKEYPYEQINSLYFDTEDLDQLERSSSGDYRKNKVRIRWYDRLEDYADYVPVFVELKSREGFASSKQRQKLVLPWICLQTAGLDKGIIPRHELMHILAGFGYFIDSPLLPVIVISYQRYRFNEISSGLRVALDFNIRSTMVNHAMGFSEADLKLAGGVIEAKGESVALPCTFKRMGLLDLDWTRFSKYSSCLDGHFEAPGTQGRNWPSGRLEL